MLSMNFLFLFILRLVFLENLTFHSEKNNNNISIEFKQLLITKIEHVFFFDIDKKYIFLI